MRSAMRLAGVVVCPESSPRTSARSGRGRRVACRPAGPSRARRRGARATAGAGAGRHEHGARETRRTRRRSSPSMRIRARRRRSRAERGRRWCSSVTDGHAGRTACSDCCRWRRPCPAIRPTAPIGRKVGAGENTWFQSDDGRQHGDTGCGRWSPRRDRGQLPVDEVVVADAGDCPVERHVLADRRPTRSATFAWKVAGP